MACFVVPAAEAVVVSAVYFAVKTKEKKYDFNLKTDKNDSSLETKSEHNFSSKLSWLIKLLLGGSFLLAFEHLWHGEVVPWFPFLTAAADPTDRAEMLHEMATVGVAMAVLVTVVWAVMVGVSYYKEKSEAKTAALIKEN